MKKESISKLKKKLDALFSRYIRYYWAIEHTGDIQFDRCYTCDRTQEVKALQNSHYIPRQILTTRYDENNCRPACYACNMLYGGMIAEYGERLKEEIGEDAVKELIQKQRDYRAGNYEKMDIDWYKEKIKEYKEKLDNLYYV